MVETVKRAWTENKFVLAVFGLVLTGLLAWGIWVTQGVYVATFNAKTIDTVCGDIDAMKKIDAELRIQAEVQAVKLDVQVLKMETNQLEILKMQAEIMKELRRR